MEKFSVFVFLTLFLVSSFVSAQITPGTFSSASIWTSISDGARSFYDNVFEPFGKFLLGQNTDTGELFFAKLLFFIVLITLVNYALSQFPPLQKRAWIISAIVSILAVRYITPTWIETIVLPYTALGIALTAFFPFILYFFFVEKGLASYSAMRKIAWIFAAVVFVGLFFYRDVNRFSNSVADFNPAFIYLITAGLSLAMLFADKTIQKAFGKARISNMMDKHKYSVDYDTTVAYDKIMNEYNDSNNPDALKPGANNKILTLNKKRKSVGLSEFDLIF